MGRDRVQLYNYMPCNQPDTSLHVKIISLDVSPQQVRGGDRLSTDSQSV